MMPAIASTSLRVIEPGSVKSFRQRARSCTRTLAATIVAFLLASASAPPCAAQPGSGQSDGVVGQLDVLFIGDDGFHAPSLRVRQVLPFLAARGIRIHYTDRLDALTPENLARFDVVAAYANHTYLSPEREQALLGYVANGGGFVPIHCASAMFGNSEAYVALVGAAFQRHGAEVFTTERVEPDHPVFHGVPEIESWDETYVHNRHNPNKTVLSVRVDEEGREPWTWVREHGQGRVFYTAWGHDERTWSNPGFQELIARGIRWAAGDWALAASLELPERPYADAATPLPYYPPGEAWGVTGDPITRLQMPLSPDESIQQSVLPPGFRLELFAAEPDVVNPIDMAWDERGRLWVVETVDYPNTFLPERRGNDRVKILEDTDGDGRADRTQVFFEGLNIPTSLTFARGGVIVAQAPHMLLLTDTDGDDRADQVDTLFSGWGTFDTHAGPSNLRYGFDNNIWGVVGYSGFDGAVGGDSVRIPQGFYRFTSSGDYLEDVATTNNNTWGLGLSDEGLVFGSTANGNPSVFMTIPKRYYERLRGTVPQPESPRRRGRGRSPVLPPIADSPMFFPISDAVYQVDHHGNYTSAAGHELYTARAFPSAYWNRAAFVTGPTGHLLGQFFIEPQGSSFEAANEWSFVASRDEWFAPIQVRVGPDGALWMIDWYNPIIQHNPTPPGYETGEGNAYETDLRDKQHSRIYRIVHEDTPPAELPDLTNAGLQELVTALSHDNLLWRLTAQRLIVERGRSDVVPMLMHLIAASEADAIGLNVAAIHALWTLHGLGALDGVANAPLRVALMALNHPSPGVRRAAAMVLPPTAGTRDAILASDILSADAGSDVSRNGDLRRATVEPAHVRLAALLALADVPASPEAGEAIASLLLDSLNATDRWIRDAATIAGIHHGEAFLRVLMQADVQTADSTYRESLRFAVATAAAHHAADDPADFLIPLLTQITADAQPHSIAFLQALAGNWPEGRAPELSSNERDALRLLLADDADADLREAAVALVGRWGTEGMIEEE